jgi:hypothetical protein
MVRGRRADLLGLFGSSAQFNWLIRRHVNLLVSYASSEKRFAIRGSDSKLRCRSPTRQLRTPPHTRFRGHVSSACTRSVARQTPIKHSLKLIWALTQVIAMDVHRALNPTQSRCQSSTPHLNFHSIRVPDKNSKSLPVNPCLRRQAMIRTAPPQRSHFSTSIAKTRFSRCAQPILDARDAPLPGALCAPSSRASFDSGIAQVLPADCPASARMGSKLRTVRSD